MTPMSRRRFVRSVAAGGVALASASLWTSAAKQDRETIAVVGAGAAGLAAARALRDSVYNVVVIEARGRIGGRIHTEYELAPHPVELGAEFIHGENVSTWDLISEFDLGYVGAFEDESGFYFHTQSLGLLAYDEWSNIDDFELLEYIEEGVEAWVDEGLPDASLAQGLAEAEISPAPEILRLANNVFASDYGADLNRLGIYGIAELSYAGDGEDDYRVREGYSRLMERLAEGLNLRLNTAVRRIRWTSDGVSIETRDGDTILVNRAIVTLPLGVLQSGDVEFSPRLPDVKTAAINGLGAGHVDKLVFKFNEAFWPDDLEAVLTSLDTQTWWRPGIARENEAPILTALIGGAAAERLEALGTDAAIREALGQLEMISGVGNLASRLVEGRFVNWGDDPFSKMGYSYVPVDGTGFRSELARPLDGRLFFAGEATHVTRAATVHGAIESGLRAANEIMRA